MLIVISALILVAIGMPVIFWLDSKSKNADTESIADWHNFRSVLSEKGRQ